MQADPKVPSTPAAAQTLVLLVDDEHDHLDLMERALRDDTHLRILRTNDPIEAAQLVRQHPVGVIVCDHRMPDLLGTRLLEECRRFRPEIIGIIVTAFPELPAVVTATQSHGYWLISKPYNPTLLLSAVKQAVAMPRMPAPGDTLTVLLVDDEPDNLDIMNRALRTERGFKVLCASSGAQALQIAAQTEPNVLVTDHRMPEMTGVQLLDECRVRYPNSVGVLVTAFAELPEVIAAKTRGAFLLLTKPCEPRVLVGAIKQAATFHRINTTLAK